MQHILHNDAIKDFDRVITGLENLCGKYELSSIYREKLKGKRLGLLANPASVDSTFSHSSSLINKIYPNQLKALFSPQHGFYAEKQDNMVESASSIDPILKIPIFSLYSTTRIPTKEMFDLIDTLIVDIQDVGTRVYTFIYTISYCLEVAAECGKEVVILDRPNPIGGLNVEGNILKGEYSSFVGRFPIPMRHGMTVGEIATLFNSNFIVEKKCDLTVIPMVGWKRKMLFSDTKLPWIPPSPNLPNPISALVYPGQVIWEGTNISEGRGTTQPFEIFGSPFIDTETIFKAVMEKVQSSVDDIKGFVLRPIAFEPTSGKWQGKVCYGFQIHVVDPYAFKPYKTSLFLLQQIIKHHSDQFRWKEPPYEYEYVKLPIDLILGDKELREALENFENIDAIEESWQDELEKFKKIGRKFYIYE
ncbi:MAG: DUF1343 domain-containing protein [Desulfamplus sp.]|nr:DUF1343 domain-containing protein [Desulfamplus sp.]